MVWTSLRRLGSSGRERKGGIVEIALIGLFGVIVGAFVSGGFQYIMESRRDRITLRAARRLTCTDLYKVVAVTDSLVEDGKWGAERDPLPTRAYDVHALVLAGLLPKNDWKLLEGSLLGAVRLEGIRADMLEEDRPANSEELQDAKRIRKHIRETLEAIDSDKDAIKPPEQPI